MYKSYIQNPALKGQNISTKKVLKASKVKVHVLQKKTPV